MTANNAMQRTRATVAAPCAHESVLGPVRKINVAAAEQDRYAS
jgi:hypothetical protein